MIEKLLVFFFKKKFLKNNWQENLKLVWKHPQVQDQDGASIGRGSKYNTRVYREGRIFFLILIKNQRPENMSLVLQHPQVMQNQVCSIPPWLGQIEFLQKNIWRKTFKKQSPRRAVTLVKVSKEYEGSSLSKS